MTLPPGDPIERCIHCDEILQTFPQEAPYHMKVYYAVCPKCRGVYYRKTPVFWPVEPIIREAQPDDLDTNDLTPEEEARLDNRGL